jgi:thioesterase domain-containing protein
VGPRDRMELQLVRIWEKVLGRQPIGVRDNFFELGGHSLLAVRLFAEIRKLFGHDLPLATLFQAPTVEQQASCLHADGPVASWSSLVPIQPAGTRPPFFCIHGAGGNVLNYRWLAQYLGTDQPVYGLQSQGLDGRTLGPQQIEEMAAHYLTEIRSVQPRGPYHLGGGSFGGVVAFEMARQLEAQGEVVALVALFDSFAPQRRIRGGLIRRIPAHIDLVRQLGPRDGMRYLVTRVRAVTQKRFVRAAWKMSARIRRRLGQPLPRTLRSVEMVNIQAQRRYVPQCYGGQLTLFRARERVIVSHPDPEMGWGPWAAGGVEIHEVPGDHITLLNEPHVQVLAERLNACLEKADTGAKVTS